MSRFDIFLNWERVKGKMGGTAGEVKERRESQHNSSLDRRRVALGR